MTAAIKPSDAAEPVADGAVLHIGGCMARMIDALLAGGVKDLPIATAIVAHIALKPEIQPKMLRGATDVERVPKVERVVLMRSSGRFKWSRSTARQAAV